MCYRITFAVLGIVLSLLILAAGTGSSKAVQNKQSISDRAILTALYNATGGAQWANKENWLSSGSLNTWNGIKTDATGRKVLEIDLSANNLSGEIPSELTALAHVESIRLEVNGLHGQIPEITNWQKLHTLNLHGNKLTGEIPTDLGNLPELRALSLSNNSFDGPLPVELTTLSKLAYLDLASLQLSGPIPKELGDMAELRWLYLPDNQFTGPIPEELTKLRNLLAINLSNNQLGGEFPLGIGNWRDMQFLALVNIGIGGAIPREIGHMGNMQVIELGQNRLVGPLPDLSRLDYLSTFYAENNYLTGEVSAERLNTEVLNRILLSGNSFHGCIPVTVASIQHNDFGRSGLATCTE